MTAAVTEPETAAYTPVPVTLWDAPDITWRAARNTGISASDVAAALGYSDYATPWQLWAVKTGLLSGDALASEAIELGIALEPWLLQRAQLMLDMPVERTPARLYAHPEHGWRLASPDGQACPPDGRPFGIEAKTSGLASGYGIPHGWSEVRVPLGFEFQARWQMHVIGWDRVDIVGLIAGIGVRLWTIHRDLDLETEMVEQVAEWRDEHLIEGVEPPLHPRDNKVMGQVWPAVTEDVIDLTGDPDILECLYRHDEVRERAKAAAADKDTAAAAIKRKIGAHEVAVVDGRTVATWAADAKGVRRLLVKGIPL